MSDLNRNNQSNIGSRDMIQESPRNRTLNSNISQHRSIIEPRTFTGTHRWLNRSYMGHTVSHNLNQSGISEGEQSGSGYIWGTRFNIDEGKKKIKKFIMEYNPPNTIEEEGEHKSCYMRNLKNVKETDYYYIIVNAMDIFNYDTEMYFYLIKYPAETILLFDQIINQVYIENILDPSDRENFEKTIRTRIINLKDKSRVRDLNPKDINHLISLKGIVVRASEIYPEMKEAYFECSKCHFAEKRVIERGRVDEPGRCKKCELKNTFEIIHNSCSFADKQHVKLQERPDEIPEGETPVNVNLIIYDDLVDECKPGDAVDIIGIFRAQPMRVSKNKRQLKSIFGSYIDVVSICFNHKNKVVINNEILKENEKVLFTKKEVAAFEKFAKQEKVYENLLKNFAPSLYELDKEKMGLLCQLFGGTPKDFTDKQRGQFRSDINILLIGDPSTAKSQLLTFVDKITPRGIYTSGKGSSAVGLTAYITKDPETKEIVLESGALVLSDRGICCIDEFDKMNRGTQSILHEVMEQQTISIAKAGIVCTLNARTAILAAANPKESRYNPKKSIVYNLSLAPSLLSRFDLIFLMLDNSTVQGDRNLGQHIINLFSPDFQKEKKIHNGTTVISQEFLTRYITYARNKYQPILTDEAETLLISSYVQMRKLGSSRNIITATPRQLESMIRLAESRAKMRLSKFVVEEDVRIAMDLIKKATQQAAIDPVSGQIDMNLISTGYSSSVKKKINNLVDYIKNLLISQEENFKIGYLAAKLKTEIMYHHGKSLDDINARELLEALKVLQEENLIIIIGNTKTEKYYIKKQIIS